MSGLTMRLGMSGNQLPVRLGRRAFRRPSAVRYDVHYLDLHCAPLQDIHTRVPVAWEIARDRDAVEGRFRELPFALWSDVDDRLAQDHWCVVGLHDGAVAHTAWAAVGGFKAHWFDRWFRLQPDDAYLYGAYTLPEFRGLRIHAASAVQRLRQLRQRGIRRVYWFVNPKNHAARRLPTRLAAARIGSVGYVEVAGIRLHYLTDIGHLSQSNAWLLLQKR